MRIFFSLIALLVVSVMQQSCNPKEDETKPDPPATGSGVISYLYNGSYIRQEGVKAVYMQNTLSDMDGFIKIKTNSSSSADPKKVFFGFFNMLHPGSYDLTAPLFMSSDIPGKYEWQYRAYAFKLELTTFDTIKHILSGTFSADMAICNTSMRENWETKPTGLQDTVLIRMGRFDLPIEW